jgi:hypothetical protein
MKYKGYIKAPRWAGLQSALKRYAWLQNFDIDIISEKGFITEEIYFTIDGTQNQIEQFKKDFIKAVADYNKE